MQTDNHVYFFVPIDTYTVFRANTTDSIKDNGALTRRLCSHSLVCNLSVWYLYSLSFLLSHRVVRQRQKEKKICANCLWCLLPATASLSCCLFCFSAWTQRQVATGEFERIDDWLMLILNRATIPEFDRGKEIGKVEAFCSRGNKKNWKCLPCDHTLRHAAESSAQTDAWH